MPNILDDESCSSAFLSTKEIAQMTGYLHSCRRVFISGDLSAKPLKKAALELVKLDFEKNESILIILESGGGDVSVTQQFADVISMLNSPVDVIIMGDCCSMAVDLVQMCRKRMILPSARILTHYIRNKQPWIADDLERLEADISYFKERLLKIREERFALYERRTGLSRERLAEMFRHGEVHDAFLSSEQALKLGLVDEIVTDFKLFPKKPESK